MTRPRWGSPVGAVGILIGAGLLLRALLLIAWRPAVLGYPDAAVYLEAARGKFEPLSTIPDSVFFDRLRPAGYPIFLRIVHGIDSHLVFVILVQHALGIATAILLFVVVRRSGVSAWWGLVPATAVLLGGSEIFAEHSALTEAIFILLVAAALYAGVRSLDSLDPGWAALSGGLIGAAADVRFVAVPLVPVLAVWIGAARGGRLGTRLVHAGAALAASAVLIGAYVYAQNQSTGYTGLTRAGVWAFYGRVAPFADCTEFTPPKGTDVLCETAPPSERPGPVAYLFASSPATRAFGFPDWGGLRISSDADNAKVAAFARAAVLHQPGAYLETVSRELVRYVFPSLVSHRPGDGQTADGFIRQLTDRNETNRWIGYAAQPYFKSSQVREHGGLFGVLKGYERWTRFTGFVMLAAILLALASPFVSRGRTRAVAALLASFAVVLMVIPPATTIWDARYAISSYGVLGAAAALGAAGLRRVIAAGRAASSGSPSAATSPP